MANISAIKVGSTSYGITATPTAHASTATTYGAATASNYGHVKLSDYYISSAGAAASGIGASSLAVCTAYNTLNTKLSDTGSWKRLTLGNGWSGELYARVDSFHKQVFIYGLVLCPANATNFSFCQVNSAANGIPVPGPNMAYCGATCVSSIGAEVSTIYLYDNQHLTIRSQSTNVWWGIDFSYRYS